MLRDIWFTFWAHSDFTDSTVSPDEIRRSEVTESHIMRPLFMDSTSLPSTAVLEELEKILSGSVFRNAGRSSRLLRFVVDETLNGRADRLKDYTLGAEALKEVGPRSNAWRRSRGRPVNRNARRPCPRSDSGPV